MIVEGSEEGRKKRRIDRKNVEDNETLWTGNFENDVPEARVEVVRLKSRQAIGPSWPERTSKRRPMKGKRLR